jgi:hypothetical protein
MARLVLGRRGIVPLVKRGGSKVREGSSESYWLEAQTISRFPKQRKNNRNTFSRLKEHEGVRKSYVEIGEQDVLDQDYS